MRTRAISANAIRTAVRGVQEFGEDLGGEPERRVCDHPKRRPWQAQSTEVCFDDARIAVGAPTHHAVAQPSRPDRIAFHRPYLDAGVEQRKRQRTPAGAEIDD